jgi:hypothetical protein
MAFYSFGGWKDSLSATPTSTARKESGSAPGPRPSPAGGRTSSTANTIGRTCTSRPPCRCDRALPVVRLLICHDALHLVNASLYGTAPRSSPTMAAPRPGPGTRSRPGWPGSTSLRRRLLPVRRLQAPCPATPTSGMAAKPSPPASSSTRHGGNNPRLCPDRLRRPSTLWVNGRPPVAGSRPTRRTPCGYDSVSSPCRPGKAPSSADRGWIMMWVTNATFLKGCI